MNFSNLLLSLENSSAPVAFAIEREFSGHDLFRLCCGILSQLPNGDEFLLCCEDSFLFAAGFLALSYSGKKICLPPNASTGTIYELSKGRILIDEKWLSTATASNTLGDSNAIESPISLFTSGSTGQRKEVTKTPEQLQSEIVILNKTWQVSGSVIATVSHQHIYGLLFKILWPLSSRRPFYCGTALYEDDLNKLFSQYPDSCLVSCPAHLDALICFKEKDFISGKPVFSSGAPLHLNTAKKMNDICGESPIEVFGSTETGGIAWRRQTDKAEWKLLESVNIRVIDETLEVKSPFIDINRWYRTGDKAEILGEREFKHLGRGDRISKVSGKRLSLTEMEDRLNSTNLINDARIIIIQENGFTQRESAAACCQLSRQGKEALIKTGKRDFIRNLRRELKKYFDTVTLPRFWRFPENMPIDNQGKVSDQLIRIFFSGIGEKNKRYPEILSLEAGPSECSAKFFIPKDLVFFNGHFEEQAILPGVTQVLWADFFADRIYGLKRPHRITKLKFNKMIFPESTVEIKLQFKEARVDFKLYSDDKTYSSGVLHYEG